MNKHEQTRIPIPDTVKAQFYRQCQMQKQEEQILLQRRTQAFESFEKTVSQTFNELKTLLYPSLWKSVCQPFNSMKEGIIRYQTIHPILIWLKTAYQDSLLDDYSEDLLKQIPDTKENRSSFEQVIRYHFVQAMDLICLGLDYSILLLLQKQDINTDLYQIFQKTQLLETQRLFHQFQDEGYLTEYQYDEVIEDYYNLADRYCFAYLELLQYLHK